jgi:hypothetical protein
MNAPAKPIRVQLSRRKGWRMPPKTVNVARPSAWGNIVRVGSETVIEAVDGNRYSFVVTPAIAKAVYEAHMADMIKIKPGLLERLRAELGGQNLACWCAPDAPCHADVLLELANA